MTVAVLVLFPVLYGGVTQLLGQDTNWDLQNYHFVDPYWLLVNHMRDVMPAQLQTYYSPILDIPFYFAVNHLSPRLIAFLLGVVQGTSFPILYLIARRFTARRLLALALAALGMFTAGAISELGTVMGDTLTAPLLLGAILLGLMSLESTPGAGPRRRRPLALVFAACAVAGIGTGLKLSGLPIALALACTFPLTVKGPRTRAIRALAAGSGLVVGVLVSYGWWAYELSSRYGNPLLPYFNQVFHSLYAPWVANTDPSKKPHGILEILFYPLVWTVDPHRVSQTDFQELSLLFLELLLLVLVLSAGIRGIRERKRPRLFDNVRQRFVMTAVVLSYFIWVVQYGTYRYLVPIEMLSFVAILICLQAMEHRIPIQEFASIGRKLTIGALALIVLASLATEVPGNWGRSSWTPRYFSARVPVRLTARRSAFLMVGLEPNGYVVPFFPQEDFFAQIEGNLPPTALVKRTIIQRVSGYGSVYLLWSGSERKVSPLTQYVGYYFVARSYGFTVDFKSCVIVPSSVGTESHPFHVCPLTATAGPSGGRRARTVALGVAGPTGGRPNRTAPSGSPQEPPWASAAALASAAFR